MSELDELVRKRRFDEIHEARRQVIDDERSLNEALATGRIDDGRARRLFQRAVDSYVRELEFLLNPPDDDDENRWWHDEPIGEIDLPNGNVRLINGLGDYLELPEEIPVRVNDVSKDHYYDVPTATQRTVTVRPPWRLLRSAFRTANAAVSDLGMELSIKDDDDGKWRFRKIDDIDDINPEEWSDLSVFGNGNQVPGDD
jgi:hypothetical protein